MIKKAIYPYRYIGRYSYEHILIDIKSSIQIGNRRLNEKHKTSAGYMCFIRPYRSWSYWLWDEL